MWHESLWEFHPVSPTGSHRTSTLSKTGLKPIPNSMVHDHWTRENSRFFFLQKTYTNFISLESLWNKKLNGAKIIQIGLLLMILWPFQLWYLIDNFCHFCVPFFWRGSWLQLSCQSSHKYYIFDIIGKLMKKEIKWCKNHPNWTIINHFMAILIMVSGR